MSNRKNIIILLLLLSACKLTNQNKHTTPNIIGQWYADSCNIQFIHGVIHVPLKDNFNGIESRIEMPFYVDFNQHGLFTFNSEHMPTKTGQYIITDTSLILTLENDSTSWLSFKLDSVVENTLYLAKKSQHFFSASKNTIELLTGEGITLKLIRKKAKSM